jgi:GNAT superfamily N-acetyltransferase
VSSYEASEHSDSGRRRLCEPSERVPTLFAMPVLHPSANRVTIAVIGAVVAAAAVGYAVHHVGPLQDHALESVVVSLALALMLIALPASAAASRLLPPNVVVAAPASVGIREATPSDVEFFAELHSAALPHGFFTQLGPWFLRAYHRTFVDSPHAVAYVAAVGDVAVGMLAGLIDPGAHTRWVMRRRGFRLALLGALGLVMHPVVGVRFLQRRAGRYVRGWRRNRRRGVAAPVTTPESAVLSHVVVLPGARRTGAGRKLVDAFVGTCRERGVARVRLLTLDSPDGAGAFYATLGWRPGDIRTTPDGHRMREWILFTSARDG